MKKRREERVIRAVRRKRKENEDDDPNEEINERIKYRIKKIKKDREKGWNKTDLKKKKYIHTYNNKYKEYQKGE